MIRHDEKRREGLQGDLKKKKKKKKKTGQTSSNIAQTSAINQSLKVPKRRGLSKGLLKHAIIVQKQSMRPEE